MIRAFDSASGQEVYALEGHLKDVQSLVLDPDGQTLVSTSNDGTATVWDLEARRAESVFETSVTAGPVVYLKKQGLLFVGNESGMLQTIDTLKNREVTVVKHLDRMGSLALHPDGSLLAAGDASGQIRLRKIAPDGNFVEEPFQPWQAHRGNVHSLVWATDGTRLFSAGDDGRVTSWNLAAQPDTPKHFSIEWKSFDFCLVPKTECLICNAAPDGSLIRWNWKTGTPLTCGSKELLFDTSASFDGKFFTAFCFDVATANTEELRLFAIPSNVDLPVDVNFLAKWRQAGTLRNARFAPDSRSIAVSRFDSSAGEEAEDSSIWLLSLPDFERIERVPVPHAKVADFSPNGEQLAIAVQSGLVLWDISKKRILWEALQQFTNHLAFSPDGTLIVTAGDQRLVTVRNASDGAIRFQMTSHRAAIVSIAFCLDGRTLATAAADGAIKLWHVATGQELIEFQHPGKIVRHVEFADDGRHLICQLRHGSHDATEVPNEIQIYDGSEIDP